MLTKYIPNIIILLTIIKITLQQNYHQQILQLEEDIDTQQQNCKDCNYQQRITELIQNPNIQNNRTQFGKSLYLYGKMMYYGLSTQENSIRKSYYFFKLAQTYGNSDSLYYISLFQNFQLDGSFNALTWLEVYPEKLNLQSSQIKQLTQYLNEKRFSEMFTNLYFAGMQGNYEAQISIGARYAKGIGVDTNCSTAALYLEQVSNHIFLEQPQIPKVIHRKRLDHDLYNIKQGVFDIFYEEDKLQILENLNFNFQRENFQEMFTLGYYYFHGLGGLKRDYKKSFEILYNLNKEQTHYYLQKMLGEMYMNGLGTQQNYIQAKDLYLKASLHNDTGALNGLGYLYINGYGVKKDLKRGVGYFKQSAALGDSDGMYNYGSLLLMPSTLELQRNFKLGHSYLSKASDLGHPQAQYALALLYLDGVDFFQNCEIAVELLRTAVQKGPWADHMKNGNIFFQKRNYRVAFLNFLQSAMMGEEVGYLNTAILADKFDILTDEDTDYDKLQESLDQDIIFQYLKENKKLRYNNLYYFLYSDYLKILSNLPIETRYEQLHKLVSTVKDTNRTMNKYIAYKSYSLSMTNFPYSALRLGDYAYYGIYQAKNYKQAFEHYQIATQLTKTPKNDTISSQGYYNLGYMTLFGEGTKKNITTSYKLFQKSIEANPQLYQYQKFIYFLIQSQNYYENFRFSDFKNKVYQFIHLKLEQYHLFIKIAVVLFISMLAGMLWITQIRIKNKIHINLKHDLDNLEFNNSNN